MSRTALALVFVALAAVSLAGCRSTRETRRPPVEAPPPPPANLPSTIIDYVDTDGFDVLFEASLVNGDAVISIRTPNEKPDWTGRLNVWIAAWNMGKNADARRFRGQIPVATIDADTLREFRLLVGAVIDRADDASKAGAMWFKEERIRSRRVELLKPYNLRFHINDDGMIHLIFFHGDYARHYPQFVTKLTECDDEERWTRNLEFSRCRKLRQAREAATNSPEQVSISFQEADTK